MKTETIIYSCIFPIIIVVIGFIVSSWFVNLVKFAKLDFKEPYKEEIIRGVGIPFSPLGVVVGYIDIKDN